MGLDRSLNSINIHWIFVIFKHICFGKSCPVTCIFRICSFCCLTDCSSSACCASFESAYSTQVRAPTQEPTIAFVSASRAPLHSALFQSFGYKLLSMEFHVPIAFYLTRHQLALETQTCRCLAWQMYYMQADNFYMIPTAEVPVTNIYRDEIYKKKFYSIFYV